jgi:cell cycle checkpoint protein
MMITNGGLTVFVDESSLVAGMWLLRAYMRFLINVQAAAAYIPAQIFDEFTYSPPIKPPTASPTPPEPSQTEETTMLEFPLRTFLDSLSIFSTGSATSASEGRAQNRRWVRDREQGGDDDVPRGRIEAYFGAAAGKTVGMRLSYAGEGHPLSLLMCVSHHMDINTLSMMSSAEGSAEPDAKFEITTYTAETQPDMSFDIEQT